MVKNVRVLVSLSKEDKYVAVIVSPAEEKELYHKITLRNMGELLEYDDKLEYCCPYYITLKKVGGVYTVVFERYTPDDNLSKHLIIKFRTLADLANVISLLEKQCSNILTISASEKEILSRHAVLTYATCTVLLSFNMYDVVKRLLIIAKKLNLF